ncbi:MAG: hypothetical protein ACM319_00305, partial [Deltaproteobacteria bacterium]|nr:hypothetical protein [Candidatus Deferrimicrobiaceae bacterium]
MKIVEQFLGRLQIGRGETFGEPTVNGRKEIGGFVVSALIAPQPRETHGGAQLPKFRALPACDRQRPLEAGLGPNLVLGEEISPRIRCSSASKCPSVVVASVMASSNSARASSRSPML